MTQNNKKEYQYSKDGHNDFHSDIYLEDGHICGLCGVDIFEITGKYKQELPPGIESQLDAYIQRIKKIKWFQPNLNLKRKDIDNQIHKIFKSFNVSGPIEYRQLKNVKDGADAWGIIREATWKSFIDMTHQTASSYIQNIGWLNAYNVGLIAISNVCSAYSTDVNEAVSGEIPISTYTKKANWFNALNAFYHSSKEAVTDKEYQYQSLDAVKWAMQCARNDTQFGLGDIFALNIENYKNKYPNGNFINIIPLWEAGLYPTGMVNGSYVVYVPSVNGEFPEDLK